MIPSLTVLVFCYGLCFGFMNKLPFLHGKNDWFDKLLQCSYCMGFHCGWIAWLFSYFMTGMPEMDALTIAPSVVVWAFSSSAFCYAVDVVIQYLESQTLGE